MVGAVEMVEQGEEAETEEMAHYLMIPKKKGMVATAVTAATAATAVVAAVALVDLLWASGATATQPS